MKVAFLGTGAMGSGIAGSIMRGGHDLSVWNADDAARKNAMQLATLGARFCESMADAIAGAECVGMSLTDDDAVEAVSAEAIQYVHSGIVVFDCSTVSPSCNRKMEAMFAEKGIQYIDSPVSGGSEGAHAGTLTVMVGGDDSAFKKVEPVIASFSSYYRRMGDIGSGQAAKLINQIITGVNQAVICEGFMLAKENNMDLNELYKLLHVSWGNSKMLERSVEQYIIPEEYTSPARIALMLKDLDLAIGFAKVLGYEIPITESATSFYRTATKDGLGNNDHSAIIKIMEKENRIGGNPHAKQ